MGKAVEHLVAATCILMSGLELNASTSLVDDEGVDLVFHRRSSSTTLALQVKSRSMNARSVVHRDRFIANVGTNTFRPRPELYLLFVAINSNEGTVDLAWLIPSEDFAARTAPSDKNRRRFSASMKPGAEDKWRPYRLSRPELPRRILEILDALAAHDS